MIQIKVTNESTRQTVLIEEAATVAQVFDKAGVSCGSGQVTWRGQIVGAGDKLSDIGVTDGDTLACFGHKSNA